VSPGLPIGAFAYSRGLEGAAHAGWVNDSTTCREWILGVLEHVYTALDGAVFWRMLNALGAQDEMGFLHADARLAASRESREMQLEDRRMAESLLSLLRESEVALAQKYADMRLTFPASFAIAAYHWKIPPLVALKGLMWTVVEAQVASAIRLRAIGHIAGQHILIDAVPVIERSAAFAAEIADSEIGNVGISLAMASAWHETQHSRLFRS
jgi:urease accessory protein